MGVTRDRPTFSEAPLRLRLWAVFGCAPFVAGGVVSWFEWSRLLAVALVLLGLLVSSAGVYRVRSWIGAEEKRRIEAVTLVRRRAKWKQ